MRPVKIITDSTSDLSGELLDKYSIDYVKMNTVYKGEEKPADLRWTNADAHALYDIIRGGERITTTQVPVDRFNEIFETYLKQGYDIVYIACSSKQSGSVNTGNVAAKALLENYPDAKVYCVDSLNSCIGEGMIAIKCAEKAAAGASCDEVYEYALSIRKNVHEYCTVHTLEHLKKAGRVSASSAFFGNLMGVKPILVADANGAQAAFKKVKGRQKAMNECIALAKAAAAPDTEVFIAHSDCSKEELDSFVEAVKKEIPAKVYHVGIIGPIVGASVGPDTIGVWVWGDKFTWAAEEK